MALARLNVDVWVCDLWAIRTGQQHLPLLSSFLLTTWAGMLQGVGLCRVSVETNAPQRGTRFRKLAPTYCHTIHSTFALRFLATLDRYSLNEADASARYMTKVRFLSFKYFEGILEPSDSFWYLHGWCSTGAGTGGDLYVLWADTSIVGQFGAVLLHLTAAAPDACGHLKSNQDSPST